MRGLWPISSNEFFFLEADEVILDASLVFANIVKVEVLNLHLIFRQFLTFKFGNVIEEMLLLLQIYAPYHSSSVLKEELRVCGLARGSLTL